MTQHVWCSRCRAAGVAQQVWPNSARACKYDAGMATGMGVATETLLDIALGD